jgi:hypothetical protein
MFLSNGIGLDQLPEVSPELLPLNQAAEAERAMVRAHGKPAAARIDVHRNNLAISLTATLAAAYPVTRRMLGESGFRDVAGAFIRWRPPVTPCLSAMGTALIKLSQRTPPRLQTRFSPTSLVLSGLCIGSPMPPT